MKRALALYCLCFVAFASIGWTSLGVSVAYASNVNYVPLAPIDVKGSEYTSTGANSKCKAPTCFPRYLRTIYNVGIALAGLFAVVSIVRGGFTLMYTDSILGHSEGKGIILRSLGGLLIVYSSYIFMNAISPSLGRDLDLSLNFPKIPKIVLDTTSFVVVSAEDVRDKLFAQRDAAQPQIRTLVEERDAKRKLADEKDAEANKLGIIDPIRDKLRGEAADLRDEADVLEARQKLIGDTVSPSLRIKNDQAMALDALWKTDYDAKYVLFNIPLRTATKEQRAGIASHLLEVMEEQRAKINLLPEGKLPDGKDKTALLNELDETKQTLQKQIDYFSKGCLADGTRVYKDMDGNVVSTEKCT